MEYIEGPDLEELLKPPHDPVFTVREVLKVAEHLAHALAHCHKIDVKHGDIKSNNVKYNVASGNYVLLDFGLAIMSQEQRRTSLRRAGAIEFMAPEQNEGQMLFETDVYSYGVILFELLAGVVPFPLNDNTETGRNTVMVAHLEKTPPDILQLRKQKLEGIANAQLHDNVPGWLLNLIYKCLEKDPAKRFASGVQLYDFYCQQSVNVPTALMPDARVVVLEAENTQLRQQLEKLRQSTAGNSGLFTPASQVLPSTNGAKTILRKRTAVLVLVATLVAGLAGWYFLQPGNTTNSANISTATADTFSQPAPSAIDIQLQTASRFLSEGKMVEALTLYSTYANQNVPEAMYMYAKLALQNKNKNLSCAEAFEMLNAAANKNFAPAKATLGFLYINAQNDAVLKQQGFYERCQFNAHKKTGARFLMEALLQGDTSAPRILSEINTN